MLVAQPSTRDVEGERAKRRPTTRASERPCRDSSGRPPRRVARTDAMGRTGGTADVQPIVRRWPGAMRAGRMKQPQVLITLDIRLRTLLPVKNKSPRHAALGEIMHFEQRQSSTAECVDFLCPTYGRMGEIVFGRNDQERAGQRHSRRMVANGQLVCRC